MSEDYSSRVAQLSARQQLLLEKLRRAKTAPVQQPPKSFDLPVSPRQRDEGPVPATIAQEQLWFLDQLAPGQPTYNIAVAVRLVGPLDVVALRIALNVLISRHESLRTILAAADDGTLRQVIQDAATAELAIDDVTALPGAQRDDAARTILMEHEVHRPFDLTRGPLFRARLVKLGVDQHVLCLAAHHSVTDGWSFGLINNEIGVLYTAAISESVADLPQPLQYGDFAVWQRQYLASGAMEQSLELVTAGLRGMSTLDVPTDRPRPPVATNRGAYYRVELPHGLRDQVRAAARDNGCSVFMVLVAAFTALLGRYAGAQEVVLGTTAPGRTRPELEQIIGDFANMVVLRTALAGDPTLAQLLDRARSACLDAWEHQLVPFEHVVQKLGSTRDTSRNPLFQIALQMLEQQTGGGQLQLPGLDTEPFDLSLHRARFDLTVSVVDDGHWYGIVAEYATDLFDERRIARLLRHFVTVVDAIITTPEARLSQLRITGEDDRAEVLSFGRGPQMPPRHVSLHQLILDQAARRPDAVAVIDGPITMTYAELAQRAEDLCGQLRTCGVSSGDVVASAIDRTAAEIVAIVGTLFAGGVYAPIDPEWPRNRIEKILTGARAKVVLTGADAVVDTAQWPRLTVDLTRAADPGEAAVHAGGPDEVAYLLHTSGSTGTPKGVVLPHHCLLNYLEWMVGQGGIDENARMLHCAASTFDLSAGEILSALISGASIVVASRETTLTPGQLAATVATQQVTHIFATPTMLSLAGEPAALTSLRVIIAAGELLTGELVQRWRGPGRRFINAYGPTEIGIACTALECQEEPSGPVLIGRPMPNRAIYVLDAQDDLAPIGVRGEIVVGGHLADGYLDPDLTGSRFVPDPVNPDETVYRTGDLGFWTEAGQLCFSGRADAQVKLRGLRIELGEIENAIQRHDQVAASAVAVKDDQLHAYLVPASAGSLDIDQVRQIVAGEVPSHMVPGRYAVVDELPLTTSGKVDRRRLAELAVADNVIAADYTAPSSTAQKQVAEAFREILGVDRVGAGDDFFHLGGHSLQAAQLLRRVAAATGITISVKQLYARPTVAALAEMIEAGGGEASHRTLVPLHNDTSRRPLFLVHAVSGSPYSYLPLARSIESHGVEGFEALGLTDGSAPIEDIPAMAARYIEDLRWRQPSGPYLLGGWSFGGFVAVEMAHQLRQAGEEIALVMLLDSHPPGPFEPPNELEILQAYADDLAGIAGKPGIDVAQELSDVDIALHLSAAAQLMTDRGFLPPELGADEILRRFAVFRANVRAMYRYQPRRYPGRLTVIGAAQSDGLSRGWNAHAEELTFNEVPGDHYSMWAPANLAHLSKAVIEQVTRSVARDGHAVTG